MTENLKAFVLPDRHWKDSVMARVMPHPRDPTTMPGFIPLKLHTMGEIMGLVHGNIDEFTAMYPSGLVMILEPNKIETSSAILPLYWIEPGQSTLDIDKDNLTEGLVVLVKPHSQTAPSQE